MRISLSKKNIDARFEKQYGMDTFAYVQGLIKQGVASENAYKKLQSIIDDIYMEIKERGDFMKEDKARLTLSLPAKVYQLLDSDNKQYGVSKSGLVSVLLMDYYKAKLELPKLPVRQGSECVSRGE